MARGLGVETKETLGETRKTIWVFGKPQSMWIPMMNPVYLTENDLWDDFSNLEKQRDLWLGTNKNYVSSFDEDLSLLFDSFCFDEFILEFDNNIKNKYIVKELISFKEMLDSYQRKCSDKEILEDPLWFNIVKKAKEIIEKWEYTV